MVKAVFRIILYVLIIFLPLTIVGILDGSSGGNYYYELGKSFALVGVMIVLMQAVLAARFKWITKFFGFDIVIRYHKYIAVHGVVLLIAHPVFLAVGGAGWGLLYSFNTSFSILLGKIGLIFLLANILLSAFQPKIKMKFERWRLIHDLLSPLIIVTAFFHGFLIGSDIIGFLPVKIFWIIIFAAEFFIFVYHLFIRPRILSNHRYTVSEVIEEKENVWTLKMIPREGPVFDYFPGQFQFLTLLRADKELSEEEHHFTISSDPNDRTFISTTIKALGDYTATIGKTKKGDKAVIHGPFGRFSYPLYPQETKLFFIAGGIGITPVISMLRYLRSNNFDREAVLLYGNKTEESIVFRDELEELAAQSHSKVKIVHVLEDPKTGWKGESGYINTDLIKKYSFTDANGVGYYIVGPGPLRESALQSLYTLGVRGRNIHMEIFNFI